MKYSRKEAIEEVRRRENLLHEKDDRKKLSVLSISAAVLLCSMVGIVYGIGGEPSSIVLAGDSYGAMLVNADVGGYILAGVIAFMAGVIITVMCVRHKRH